MLFSQLINVKFIRFKLILSSDSRRHGYLRVMTTISVSYLKTKLEQVNHVK